MTRKECHNSYNLALHHEWVSSECNHSFSFCPVLIANPRVANYLIGQMRFALQCDESDFELADWYTGMSPVDVSVHAGASLEFQHVFGFFERPDSGEGGVEMLYQCLAAVLQSLWQGVALRQGKAYLGGQCGQAGTFGQILVHLL